MNIAVLVCSLSKSSRRSAVLLPWRSKSGFLTAETPDVKQIVRVVQKMQSALSKSS